MIIINNNNKKKSTYIHIGVAINKKWILHSVFIQFYFKITPDDLGEKGTQKNLGENSPI